MRMTEWLEEKLAAEPRPRKSTTYWAAQWAFAAAVTLAAALLLHWRWHPVIVFLLLAAVAVVVKLCKRRIAR